jgi:predicted ATP-dependent serine protease
MNPFAERFEQKFARAQDQVARKSDGHRHNADKPQEASMPSVANVATAALVSRCAADIAPEKIEWRWPRRLALGKHISIAGEPGTGKSQLLIAIVATLTTGGNWPCGEGRAPIGNAIILSAEDGAADTIVPRLLAAGADLNRVHVVSAVRNADGSRRTLNLQNDLDLLERKIGEIGDVALVGIDPVSSYLGKTDSHKNSEVRGVLEPLSEMAERTRVAVLSVTHFAKAGAKNTTKALHRFIGSIAFTGAPRAAFVVIEDAEHNGRRLFLHAKNNLARAPQGLAFRLEQCTVGEDIVASRIWWDTEPVAITADEALAADAAGTETRTAKAEAMELLEAALAGA